MGRPLLGARLTLRQDNPGAGRPFQADATVLMNGRPVAAHKAGRSPLEAAELAVDSLRRQIRITSLRRWRSATSRGRGSGPSRSGAP